MTYDRDVENLHIEPSVFTFPGDELLSSEDYAAVMRNTYLRKLPFALMLIERFGLSSSQENQERIKRGLVCMGWLDHMLDESPDREASLHAYTSLVGTLALPKEVLDIPSWVRPEVPGSVVLLCNAVNELSQEDKAAISVKAQRIGEISLEKCAIDDVVEYCAVLSEEGALSSDVVIECMDSHTQNTDAYKRLRAFNARAMVAATLLDAAIDMKQDFNDGLTNVDPTLRNRLFLYRKALKHLPYIIKNLGIKGIVTTIKVGVN